MQSEVGQDSVRSVWKISGRGEIMLKTFCIAAAVVSCAATLSAQVSPYPDTFKINYFSNAHAPDDVLPPGTVQVTNVGTQTGSKTDPGGNLCAMIYVFQPDQELAECCGCKITPDGLLTLNIDHLTANPLTPVTITSGVIKIVSSYSSGSTCDPTKPVPATGIRAWATHIQNYDYPYEFETETEFSDSNLGAGELGSLKAKCAAIAAVGSGAGVCTCGGGV
jgi:hypothetical protein